MYERNMNQRAAFYTTMRCGQHAECEVNYACQRYCETLYSKYPHSSISQTQKKANKPGRMKGKEDERINKTGQEKATLTFQH